MAVPPKHKRLVSWGENNSHYNLYRQQNHILQDP